MCCLLNHMPIRSNACLVAADCIKELQSDCPELCTAEIKALMVDAVVARSSRLATGAMPLRNFLAATWPEAEDIFGEGEDGSGLIGHLTPHALNPESAQQLNLQILTTGVPFSNRPPQQAPRWPPGSPLITPLISPRSPAAPVDS